MNAIGAAGKRDLTKPGRAVLMAPAWRRDMNEPSHPPDEILIHGLELPTRIGVPDEERAAWQTLRADVVMRLGARMEELGDEIGNTVDYDEAARSLRALAAERPRRLIETLAAEMAGLLLEKPAVQSVTLTLRKRVLPGVDDVAVRVTRCKG
jgi:dihydroneopterin aldolase